MNGTNEILILHATCGGGHKSAARALEKAFRQADPTLEIEVVDALDGMNATSRKLYTGSFEAAVAHAPAVYGAFFSITKNLDRSPVFRAARGVSNRIQCEKLTDLLRARQPRAIVCTHFMPLEVALREKRAGRISAPIYAVVTDYVAHGFWRQAEADVTFCPPGRAAADLVLGGVPAEKIQKTGIPIDPNYAKPYDVLVAKKRAGLPLTRPTILLLAGGAGMGPLVEVLRETARAVRETAEIVVVCGKNQNLQAECAAAALDLPAPIRVLGFVDPIADLLQGADVIVTKPGGLTTSECLALGKAIVFYEAAPGQESANARYCVDRDAGVDGGKPSGAAHAAALLARNPALRDRLGRRARRVARPDAAAEIVAVVLARSEAWSDLALVA
jgi:processive 1,2-diacylglycerol beta-glucosyltransferase